MVLKPLCRKGGHAGDTLRPIATWSWGLGICSLITGTYRALDCSETSPQLKLGEAGCKPRGPREERLQEQLGLWLTCDRTKGVTLKCTSSPHTSSQWVVPQMGPAAL